jgi:hypothetical protein
MNSHNPYSEDELDPLVRGALKARVSGLEPPDRVWEHIKVELEAEQPAPPRRSQQVAWMPLAVQAALTLLLVMLGGFGLRTLLVPNSLQDSLPNTTPAQTIAYVGEPSVSSAVVVFDDQAELRSLRADLGSGASQPIAELDNRPPIVIPRDVPPNALFQEGRVLEPELSLSLIVEEQNPIRSGPYPWYR